MATTREFIDYIAEQADLGAAFTHKRMFGEYGLYQSTNETAWT